ncbi:conserved Plasmodium protein, unknown function [Plasmodium berghei]|uniref:Uncharacterized protein n=2 Tax=Plasmodium berghei TaxID=5821 RepID=A0A509AR84_PLABA|nr:conserved protein, unknown function [Plasmodium berghei ANKA]CXI81485.1 conserved Plasmodium protein, unknown function [Plasmodium berghei]SCO62059.1 conserved Plasmodium protein, unknown function [Plasmodium berghei]SCO63817.1 conserved Plasmodium protein, unknown function [Plasmodium berghei]VUC57245.1 conserved protein, unknown function [Plasmodium berghei ANKA]|eukprot:XP_034423024.1 conserved protein, unknown function [Plasmodium berghei ANKA]
MILYLYKSFFFFFFFFFGCNIKLTKSLSHNKYNQKIQPLIQNGKRTNNIYEIPRKRNKFTIQNKLLFIKNEKIKSTFHKLLNNKNYVITKLFNVFFSKNYNYQFIENENPELEDIPSTWLIIPSNKFNTFLDSYIFNIIQSEKTFSITNNIDNNKPNVHKYSENNEHINNKPKTNVLAPETHTKIERYITSQLIKLASEILNIETQIKKIEKEKLENKNNSNNIKEYIKWNFYLSKKDKPLKCFVYVDVPDGTVMVKPREMKENYFLISINALNDIKRNNQDILKNIFFKKFNITFDHIYNNCSFLTLIVNKIINKQYIIDTITLTSLLSSFYLTRDFFYQVFLQLLSSEIIWNPYVYNIWCNIYHTTLPLKLFMIKQAYSYSNILFNYITQYVRSRLIKLETKLINNSLKKKILMDTIKDNIYDKKLYTIATDSCDRYENEFYYI